ncbi:response regulator transcription factor [uncultured Clostridium sp.]|jgi:DNA-binding response OmpR family regulator|uniref:response regulator transcription factor n=1 Tax=uncultured Clostridium sp. TaxID=59620 RepID=UPI00260CF7A2|nr:response regulator transcription factor [uncultured Clostridium sp.]
MINILLVEDDVALSYGIVYALKKEGFNILHGDCIESSRIILKNNNIDIVLLDVMLPDGDGYNFCEEILGCYKENIGIIFMTALDDEFNVVLGLDLGADDYMSKPLRIKELVSRINAVHRRKQKNIIVKNEEGKAKSISSGDIVLYVEQYKGNKKDMDLKLTLLEYKLLLILLENYPRVVSRDILLDKLWDFEGNFVDANTLNVYIRRLREKIESDLKNPVFIETVRGVGYRWICEVKK